MYQKNGKGKNLKRTKKIIYSNINKNLKKTKYSIRSPDVDNIENHQNTRNKSIKFKKIIKCNIGNPLAFNSQKPISFIREVLSIVINPELFNTKNFKKDVIKRAKKYLNSTNIGAYTNSQGLLVVRKEVSEFLKKRDGYESEPDNIFLTNGASDAIQKFINLVYNKGESILIPSPEYPLYSGLASLLDIKMINYNNKFNISIDEINKKIRSKKIKSMVVINPNNPTGEILEIETMKQILLLCFENNICLIADEVYQSNIYINRKFTSFRKLAYDMGLIHKGLQLVSLHSTSKGVISECGLRGGYMEILGFSEKVMEELIKLCSLSLCSNSIGQITVGLMVNPPKKGDESYEKYNNEINNYLDSYKKRALLLSKGLNSIKGIKCSPIESALYAYPQIDISNNLIKKAKSMKMKNDEFYCTELLKNTGILVIPGSGFSDKDNNSFRLTILPPEKDLKNLVKKIRWFNKFINS